MKKSWQSGRDSQSLIHWVSDTTSQKRKRQDTDGQELPPSKRKPNPVQIGRSNEPFPRSPRDRKTPDEIQTPSSPGSSETSCPPLAAGDDSQDLPELTDSVSMSPSDVDEFLSLDDQSSSDNVPVTGLYNEREWMRDWSGHSTQIKRLPKVTKIGKPLPLQPLTTVSPASLELHAGEHSEEPVVIDTQATIVTMENAKAPSIEWGKKGEDLIGSKHTQPRASNARQSPYKITAPLFDLNDESLQSSVSIHAPPLNTSDPCFPVGDTIEVGADLEKSSPAREDGVDMADELDFSQFIHSRAFSCTPDPGDKSEKSATSIDTVELGPSTGDLRQPAAAAKRRPSKMTAQTVISKPRTRLTLCGPKPPQKPPVLRLSQPKRNGIRKPARRGVKRSA